MSDRDEELREALDELAADLGSGGAHPEADELAAYYAGELPPQEENALQDHLAACPECAALLLDLEGLSDRNFGGASGLAGKEEVWQRLRDETRLSREEAAAPAPVMPFRRRTVSTSPRWLQALAAALLVAAVGQSLWVMSLRQGLQEATRPRTARVLQLSSRSVRGEGTEQVAPSVRASDPLVLIIPIPLSARSTRYRVVIARANGEEIWQVAGLSPGPGGSLLPVVVPARALFPGDYRMRVLGEGGEPIADQPLHVESP